MQSKGSAKMANLLVLVLCALVALTVCFPSVKEVCPPGVNKDFSCDEKNLCVGDYCKGHPNADCVVMHCGRCRKEHYVRGENVTCEPKDCEHSCSIDPCEDKICANFPQADCRADFCRGCTYSFFLADVKMDCGPDHS